MRKEHSEEIAAKFIAQLKQGVVPWRKPWTPIPGTQLHNRFSKRPYRGINTLILGLEQITHGYSSPAWTTYKAAAERGHHVRKGEKGTKIVFWKPGKVEDKTTGEEKSVLIARLYTVFNTDQIDGLGWDAPDMPEPIAVPDALANIYHGYQGAPEIVHGAQDRACYVPSVDKIFLPLLEQFGSVQGYAETYCHEIVHSTGHPDRLGRFETNDIGCHGDYAREELVAEIGASMLMQHAGIDVDMPQMASYVGSWLRALEDDHSLIIQAAQRAQKAVDHVLGVTPTSPSENEEKELVTA